MHQRLSTPSHITDKYLGKSYDVVKAVYEHLPELIGLSTDSRIQFIQDHWADFQQFLLYVGTINDLTLNLDLFKKLPGLKEQFTELLAKYDGTKESVEASITKYESLVNVLKDTNPKVERLIKLAPFIESIQPVAEKIAGIDSVKDKLVELVPLAKKVDVLIKAIPTLNNVERRASELPEAIAQANDILASIKRDIEYAKGLYNLNLEEHRHYADIKRNIEEIQSDIVDKHHDVRRWWLQIDKDAKQVNADKEDVHAHLEWITQQTNIIKTNLDRAEKRYKEVIRHIDEARDAVDTLRNETEDLKNQAHEEAQAAAGSANEAMAHKMAAESAKNAAKQSEDKSKQYADAARQDRVAVEADRAKVEEYLVKHDAIRDDIKATEAHVLEMKESVDSSKGIVDASTAKVEADRTAVEALKVAVEGFKDSAKEDAAKAEDAANRARDAANQVTTDRAIILEAKKEVEDDRVRAEAAALKAAQHATAVEANATVVNNNTLIIQERAAQVAKDTANAEAAKTAAINAKDQAQAALTATTEARAAAEQAAVDAEASKTAAVAAANKVAADKADVAKDKAQVEQAKNQAVAAKDAAEAAKDEAQASAVAAEASAQQAADAQIPADWNQTDDTKKDFIKNKPDLTVYALKNEILETLDEIIASTAQGTQANQDAIETFKKELTKKLEDYALKSDILEVLDELIANLAADATNNADELTIVKDKVKKLLDAHEDLVKSFSKLKLYSFSEIQTYTLKVSKVKLVPQSINNQSNITIPAETDTAYIFKNSSPEKALNVSVDLSKIDGCGRFQILLCTSNTLKAGCLENDLQFEASDQSSYEGSVRMWRHPSGQYSPIEGVSDLSQVPEWKRSRYDCVYIDNVGKTWYLTEVGRSLRPIYSKGVTQSYTYNGEVLTDLIDRTKSKNYSLFAAADRNKKFLVIDGSADGLWEYDPIAHNEINRLLKVNSSNLCSTFSRVKNSKQLFSIEDFVERENSRLVNNWNLPFLLVFDVSFYTPSEISELIKDLDFLNLGKCKNYENLPLKDHGDF